MAKCSQHIVHGTSWLLLSCFGCLPIRLTASDIPDAVSAVGGFPKVSDGDSIRIIVAMCGMLMHSFARLYINALLFGECPWCLYIVICMNIMQSRHAAFMQFHNPDIAIATIYIFTRVKASSL